MQNIYDDGFLKTPKNPKNFRLRSGTYMEIGLFELLFKFA